MTRTTPRRQAGIRVVLAVVLLLGAWAAVTTWAAHRDLTRAQADLRQAQAAVVAGDVATSRARVTSAGRSAAAAERWTLTFPWDVAAAVPLLRSSVRPVRDIAAAAATVTHEVLPPALDAAELLAPGRLRDRGGRIDLDALAAAAAPLDRAVARADLVQHALKPIPRGWVAAPVVAEHRRLRNQVGALARGLRAGATAASLGPPMLGADGPRRYFVGIQNLAETRGSGGLLGAFLVVTADDGSLEVTASGSNEGLPRSDFRMPERTMEQQRLYPSALESRPWSNANRSPHLPWAAAAWAGYWERGSGERVDGVVAIDAVTLSHVLEAGGPVEVAGGPPLTADNVVEQLLVHSYRRHPDVEDREQRQAYLQAVSQLVAQRVTSGSVPFGDLLRALGYAATTGHVGLWSRHEREQEQIAAAGSLAQDLSLLGGRAVGLTTNNLPGGKLDFYLHRDVSYEVSSCGRETQEVVVRASLENRAPPVGLPAYVVLREDEAAPDAPRSQNRLEVLLYVPEGSRLVEGPAGLRQDQEQGLTRLASEVTIDPGQRVELEIRLLVPVSAGKPRSFTPPSARTRSVRIDADCPS